VDFLGRVNFRAFETEEGNEKRIEEKDERKEEYGKERME